MVEFYTEQPTPTTAWRMAVLMGANTRTYKFALGAALLEQAAQGKTEVSLQELAAPYALALIQHAAEMPQARSAGELGETDFLTVATREAEETLRTGTPTEKLVDAAVRSMPGMVMQKFHNLAGSTEIPHRFYELSGTGSARLVRLTPELRTVAGSQDLARLTGELDARWRIVETSFSAGIGTSLLSDGLAVDAQLGTLVDKRRRRSVAGLTDAVIGFQHGRCHICTEVINRDDLVAVDHVFPFSLMSRGLTGPGAGLDLDAVWNLAPAHAVCNGRKSNRMPSQAETQRLVARNEAIMNSPRPLRRTLVLTLVSYGYPGRAGDWVRFCRALMG